MQTRQRERKKTGQEGRWNRMTFPGLRHWSGAQVAQSLQGVDGEQGAYSGKSSVAPQNSAFPIQCLSPLGGVAFCLLSFLPPGLPCLWLGRAYIIIDHWPGNSTSSVPGHSLLTHQSLSIDLEFKNNHHPSITFYWPWIQKQQCKNCIGQLMA